jgi:serine/threonine-protein kinase
VKIKSEHVARVSDVGELPSGAPYMVMEYLEGIDLGDWLEKRGRLSVEQAAEFVLQACEAIAEAHAIGIIHRDLKPRNLFVVRRADGLLSVKVLDFGISKTTGLAGSGSDLGMTKTTAVMGSPLYMTPEQMLASRDADARSDIWALGVILYELLTAALPFVADTMPELVAKILNTTPALLRQHRADIPPGLEAIINRCLDKDRGHRFQTIGEFALALFEFAPRRAKASVERISGVMSAAGMSGTSLRLPPSSDSGAPAAGAGTAAAWGTTAAKPRSGGKAIAGVIVAAVMVAGTAAVVMRKGAAPSPAESSSGATAKG